MKVAAMRAKDARATKRAAGRASIALAILLGLAFVEAPPADAARLVIRTIRLQGYVGTAPGGTPVEAKWSVDLGEKSIDLEVTKLQIVAGPGTASDVIRALKPYRAAAFQNLEATGAVRIAPVGYVREDHRDVIAEIASELLRIEGTSIAIAVAVTERGTEVSVRADSRLLGEDQARIVRVIDELLGYAFPGVSGFKYERRPPHRVEGGACVPHSEAQERLWGLGATAGAANGDPILEHCRACARALVAALRDLKFARPDEIQGLL